MNREIRQAKSELRRSMRRDISGIPPDRRTALSRAAVELILRQPEWIRARAILLYSAMSDELDLSPLIEVACAEGKIISFPRFISDEAGYVACHVPDLSNGLVQGKFGIMEPCDSATVVDGMQLDLAFVPGVAFDLEGRRLGRGKGFYDRLLQSVPATKCGVAYDVQVRSEIPVEPHDMMLNCLVTPTRWIRFGGRPTCA